MPSPSGLRRKTYEEIVAYGNLFISHLAEAQDKGSSDTFSDGVPKEGIVMALFMVN